MSDERDVELANLANAEGAHYSLRIIRQARESGLGISLGFALINVESNFTNVFGHDDSIFCGAGQVTEAKYRDYKRQRGTPGQHMQGVGPAQLTWWEFQDAADRRGGCWIPKHNISLAFDHLAALIDSKGKRAGIKAYNGSGAAADRYASKVLDYEDHWHRVLT